MRLKTKIKRRRESLKIKALRLLEQSRRIALAVVILQFVLAGGYALAVKKGILPLKGDTIIIKQVEAQATKAIEIITKEETIPEIITRVADTKGFADVELLKRIAFCESSYNPRATTKLSSAKGLFQILDMHGLTVEERFNPEIATAWTIDKINAGGLNAWDNSRHCWDN